jgi:integrase
MTDATPATPPKRRRSAAFGTVTKSRRRWRARYVDRAGDRHSRTFDQKADAYAWLSEVQTDLARGDRTDPRKGRQTFDVWATKWQESRIDHEPKTVEATEAILRLHVLPFFRRYEVAAIDQSLVQKFVRVSLDQGAKPNSVRNRYRIVFAVLRHAVEGKALASNPAVGVRLKAARKEEKVYLDAPQVEALAEAISNPVRQRGPAQHFPEHGLRVRFAAYSGMRAGEIVALRAGNVDTVRHTVTVVETTVIASGQVMEGRPPKTEQSERTIRIPRFLSQQLAEHLGARAADRKALVFPGPDGGPMLHNTWYRVHFQPAVRQAGLDPAPRFHDLRHTCVALLVKQGAHALAISRHLGHSTIKTTMDTYGHVLEDAVDEVADRLDATYAAALAKPLSTGTVHDIRGMQAV